MGFRETKQKSRRDLHNRMKVSVNYYAGGVGSPLLIYVRIHNKSINQGDQAGTSLGYAEVREDAPRVIFDKLEVAAPSRKDVVIVSATEGYRINNVDPADGEFQVATANQLSAADLAGYAAPGASGCS